MRFTNEHRRVPIAAPGGRVVEGVVHVRGAEMRVRGSGVTFETHRPVAVTVRNGNAFRRLAIEEPRTAAVAVAVAAPVAAWLLVHLLNREEKER